MDFPLVPESRNDFPVAVHGLLTAVASLVAECGFSGTLASVTPVGAQYLWFPGCWAQ